MKKLLLIAATAALLLLLCAVPAFAAEPVSMELTAPPEKTIYTAETDGIERVESVWDANTGAPTETTFLYYPPDFTGLAVTLGYADGTSLVFRYDDHAALSGAGIVLENRTVQTAAAPWTPGEQTITLRCGALSVSFPVTVRLCEPTLVVQTPPSLLRYRLSDFTAGQPKTPDTDGLVLSHRDENGTVSTLTPADDGVSAVFPAGIAKPGTYEVQVSARGLRTSYTITVYDSSRPVSISVYSPPEKTVYMPSEALPAVGFDGTYQRYAVDLTGLVLVLTYENGDYTYHTVTDADRLVDSLALLVEDGQSPQTPWETGAHTVKLTWQWLSCEFTVYADVEGHDLQNLVCNGDGTHTQTCSVCGTVLTQTCSGTPVCGERTVCDLCQLPFGEPLPHSFAMFFNSDTHWGICSVCEETLAPSAHAYRRAAFRPEAGCYNYDCTGCTSRVYGRLAGDVDGNGRLEAADARLVLRASVELEELSPEAFEAANMDTDRVLTAADARTLLRIVVGLETARRGALLVGEDGKFISD